MTETICSVCGFKAATVLDVLIHAQNTEDDDQHQRWISAAHGTGLTTDLERYRAIKGAPR